MSGIIKENVLLDGPRLVECNKKLEEYSLLGKGNKLHDTEPSSSEERITGNTIENLYELLKIERVYLANKRSKGIYETDKNRIKILSVVGKLSNFGYFEDKQLYIEPYEALLLMEMNRLEVLYDTVTLSIEQGYGMFFDATSKINLKEYVVYSYFSRIGYIIMKHDGKYDEEKYRSLEEKRKINKEDEMIWCILMEKLNMPYSRDVIDDDYDLYLKIKSEMNQSSAAISGRVEEETKELPGPPKKKLKLLTDDSDKNFLDILKTELEYLSYEQIFRRFSYISREEFEHSDIETLDFTFDLFLPKAQFKRTENLANYRIIVLKSNEKFPSNVELQNLFDRQCYKVPLVIALVSEDLSVNYSICTF